MAGRRFGKSHLSLIWLLSRGLEENERRWIVTPNYRQGRNTTWKLMRQMFREYDCKINETDLSVKMPNGSEVAIRGAENENSLRGVGLTMVVMEEYSYIKPHVWDEIIYPTLPQQMEMPSLLVHLMDTITYTMLISEAKAMIQIGSHGSILLLMVDMYQKKRSRRRSQ